MNEQCCLWRNFEKTFRIISPVSIRSFPGVLSKWLLMTAIRVNMSLILRTASPLEPFSQCPEKAYWRFYN